MSRTHYFSVSGLDFEWDADKAIDNRVAHDVTFEVAATSFLDPIGEALSDRWHSVLEERWRWLGRTSAGQLLATSYTLRGRRYRLISARPATKRERHEHQQAPL